MQSNHQQLSSKIAGNIFFLITSANQISLPPLLCAGAPQLRWSKEFSKKQMPINLVSSACHKKMGHESIAFLSDPSEHCATWLSILDFLKFTEEETHRFPKCLRCNDPLHQRSHCLFILPTIWQSPTPSEFPNDNVTFLKEVQLTI
jgi:hypothetical protein